MPFPNTEIRKADPPFDDPKADVIIRSSDNIDFYVFKALLEYSSSVFTYLFCVAEGNVKEGDLMDGLQVIHTDDDAETLDLLFRLSYPLWAAGSPVLKSLDELLKVFKCSRKYQMAGAEKMILENLIVPSFLETEPMRVFAMACMFRLEAEAKVAAKHTLRIPILPRPFVPEMENMTARTLHRLQEYHLQCGKVASEVAKSRLWIKKTTFIWFNDNYDGSGDPTIIHDARVWVKKWWKDYMESAARALEDRPLGVTVLGQDLLDEALTNAINWEHYSDPPKVIADLREFGELFAAEVDRATAEVVLDIQL